MAKKIIDLALPTLPLVGTELLEMSEGGSLSVKVAVNEALTQLYADGSVILTTDSTTGITVLGDIHCDDLFTSGDTIHVGSGQIKSTAGNIELYGNATKALEIGDTVQTLGIATDTSVILNQSFNTVSLRGNNTLAAEFGNFGIRAFYVGNQVFRTQSNGVLILDATNPGTALNYTFGNFNIQNATVGGGINFRAKNSISVDLDLIKSDPDGAVELYNAGIKTFETMATGALVSEYLDAVTGHLKTSGDLSIEGNLYVDGTTWVVHNQEVTTSDNLIVINYGEVGPGVTAGFAGIEVDRGTLTDYQFLFYEDTDTFRIGEIGSLQAVATREDVPIEGAFPYWNNVENRFDTTDAPITYDGTSVNITAQVDVNHNALANIQGGQVGEYYHLTSWEEGQISASSALNITIGTAGDSFLYLSGSSNTVELRRNNNMVFDASGNVLDLYSGYGSESTDAHIALTQNTRIAMIINGGTEFQLTDAGMWLKNSSVYVNDMLNVTDADDIDGSSTDKQLATAKLIYDYVEAQISGGVSHNSTTGLQGGDSTALEFYHLTQDIHDLLFSESPTIGMGDSNVNVKVDPTSELITMVNNSGVEVFRSRVQSGNAITNIGNWLGNNYISVNDSGGTGSIGMKAGNLLSFYLSLNTQRFGPSTGHFMEVSQSLNSIKLSFDGAPNVEHIFDDNGLQLSATGATVAEFSTDGTLSGDSDTAVPTEKATKTYVDTEIANLMEAGNIVLSTGDTTADVVFLQQQGSTLYSQTWSLEYTGGGFPSHYLGIVFDKTIDGFKVLFSGEIDSDDYILSWVVIDSLSGSSSSSSSSSVSSSSSSSSVSSSSSNSSSSLSSSSTSSSSSSSALPLWIQRTQLSTEGQNYAKSVLDADGYMLVGTDSFNDAEIWGSPDGIDWELKVNLGGQSVDSITAMTYDSIADKAIAGTAYGDAKIYEGTGPERDTWTELADINTLSGGSVAYIHSLLYVIDTTSGVGTIIAGTGDKAEIWISTNDGTNWSLAIDIYAITGEFKVRSLCFDSLRNRVLAGTSNGGDIYKSDDFGATWSLLANNPFNPAKAPQALAYDVEHDAVLAGTGFGADGQLWKSTDGGATWTLKNTFAGSDYVESLHYHPVLESTFIGLQGPGQIWVTADGGESVSQETATLSTYVYDMDYSPDNLKMLAGITFGGEVWTRNDYWPSSSSSSTSSSSSSTSSSSSSTSSSSSSSSSTSSSSSSDSSSSSSSSSFSDSGIDVFFDNTYWSPLFGTEAVWDGAEWDSVFYFGFTEAVNLFATGAQAVNGYNPTDLELTFGNIGGGGTDTFTISVIFTNGTTPVTVNTVAITNGVPYVMDLTSGGDYVQRLLIQNDGTLTGTFSVTNLRFFR